ncbi:MAG: hypothetical protein LUD83_03490 [Clostridiales bacterium]|nr:hypothetical protein [Clostridiales bacterium]
MEAITTLKTHGRTFKIVHYDGYFCAVEDKYITDGKLNTVLYGPALHTGSTVEECIRFTETACEVDDLVAQGVDARVAAIMVAGHVDYCAATKLLAYALEAQ